MRFAYSTLACPARGLEEALELGVRAGYEGVELRLIDGELVDPGIGAQGRRRVAAACARAGLPIVAVDSSIRVAAPADTSDILAQLGAFLDMAAEWSAPTVRVFGGELPHDPAARHGRLAAAAGVLERACDRAERLGVRVGVETHDAFLASATVGELLALVPSPWIGAVWDSHHPCRAGESVDQVYAAIGPRLCLAQVKDAARTGTGPDDWRLVPLGEGDVPVREMLRLLMASGYRGWVSVEWEKHWHPEIEEPEIALPQHMRVLRTWMAELGRPLPSGQEGADTSMVTARRNYGFGIIGCGVIAPTHAEALAALPNARLVAVTDIVPEKARSFAEERGVGWDADLDALLARPDIDVVSVCVPSGLHADIGIRAAHAGKHLVVEKPIDVTVAAADRLLDAAESAGVLLTVISQHRFDAGPRRLRELVDQGRLGRLVLGDAAVMWYRSQAYYDSGGWRGTWALDGGGALMNQGIHYVDLLCWILGPVQEVTALCATQAHTIEVEDVALALLRFRSGAIGVLQATTAAYPGFPERLEICGTGGSAVVEAGDLKLAELADEKGDVGPYGGRPGSAVPAGATAAADPAAIASEAHRAQLADFLTALDDGRQPIVTGEQARADVALIRAVYESARSGQSVTPAPPRRSRQVRPAGLITREPTSPTR